MKIILLVFLIKFIDSNLYYIVRPGDTLKYISIIFSINITEILAFNNIQSPFIYVGQRIFIGVIHYQMNQMGWNECNLRELNNCLKRFEIDTFSRIRHFISQFSYESTCGIYNQEIEDPKYCFKDESIGDLENTKTEEECGFKDEEYIKLNGRSNYKTFAEYILHNRVMKKVFNFRQRFPWILAGYWWHGNGMNKLCDTNPSVEIVTKRVNGGYNGLAERKRYYSLACSVFI